MAKWELSCSSKLQTCELEPPFMFENLILLLIKKKRIRSSFKIEKRRTLSYSKVKYNKIFIIEEDNKIYITPVHVFQMKTMMAAKTQEKRLSLGVFL